jgi:predicted transposase YdaD
MATLSQAYLDWEKQTEQRGIALGEQRGREIGQLEGATQEAATLILRQLTHRFSDLPLSLSTRIEQLPLAQLEALSVAWLDWQGEAEVEEWLENHSVYASW